MAYQLRERLAGTIAVLELQGELTLGGGSRALEAKMGELVGRGCPEVLLECSQVEAIDSVGIGILAGCTTSAMKHGGKLKLLNPSQRMRAALKLVCLDTAIESYEDEATALASFEGKKEKPQSTLSRMLGRLGRKPPS